MKRVISACLEQTQKFETESDYENFIKGLERKRVKYKIVDKLTGSDNTVIVKLKRDYGGFSVGNYLD